MKTLTDGKTLLFGLCILLSSCGSATDAISPEVTEMTLAAIGIRNAEKLTDPHPVVIQFEAAKALNADEEGHGLPTVARLYKLRSPAAFMATPYVHFTSPETEKLAFGEDVVEVKELTLLPGKRTEISEKMPSDAAYIGVVALFRSPAANRWRLTFPTPASKGPAIKIGAHTCALTATTLAPLGMTLSESTFLSASRCR